MLKMKLSAKNIFRVFFIGLISILYLFCIYLFFSTITDYKPQKIENIAFKANHGNDQIDSDELSLLSWNNSYAGISKEMDVFYKGGKKLKPTLAIYQKTLNGILNTLVTYAYVDFMLLQEVDVFSNRSYFSNQKVFISDFLPDYGYAYAVNQDVKFSLCPFISSPGRLKSGLQTLTKFNASDVEKQTYSSMLNWPEKLFRPHSCFLATRYLLENGKQLVVINTQISAGELGVQYRKEIEELKVYVISEYKKGNYVIAGGDWNINPPGFKKINSFKNDNLFYTEHEIPSFVMPSDWKWVYDAEVPTLRKSNKFYNPVSTPCTVSDFFLISPNIASLSIRNIDLHFEFSDHNPVLMNVKLK
jgi:endonuclease/exonuclease/phosphatase family metal-dependent hydrolase